MNRRVLSCFSPRARISVEPRPLLLTCSPGNSSEATLASGSEPRDLGPLPLSQRPLRPPGSRLAERIYLHISTFVPCWRPISARGEAGVLGGARAPAAAPASSCCGRRFPSGSEPLWARRALQPQPRPPSASALLPLLGQALKARTKRLSGRLCWS